MKLETFQYQSDGGWSVDCFPDLDSENTLIIVFCASEFINETKPFYELKEFYKTAKIVGCSTAGEIFDNCVYDHTISVAVVKFEKTRVKLAVGDVSNASESFEVGTQLSDALAADDLKAVLVLSDGLNINGTDLVNGLREHVGSDVVVTGGLAGDGDKFSRTWVLDNLPQENKVSAVGLYGDHVGLTYGSNGGWDNFGPSRVITKSENNVLYELDGQPALDLYKKYLGERASGLPATALLFPLTISMPGDEESIVRTVLSVDEEANSMTFAGDVPEGWSAQLMCANFDRLIGGASSAAEFATKSSVKSDALVLAISCVGRRLILGERTEEEIDAVLDKTPENSKLIGYYSYGEISPTGVKNCELHNQTMTLTIVVEK